MEKLETSKVKSSISLYFTLYMIEEICFCVLLKYLETQSKFYGGAFFASIVNNFQLLTIFARKLHHRCSMVDHSYKNS